jgi:hypothetical protein
MDGKTQAMFVDIDHSTGGNQGFTDELFATIAQDQAVAFDMRIEFPFLGKVIFDFEQISKVSRRLYTSIRTLRSIALSL